VTDDAPKRDRSRTHDLVLYGATGFTGGLVAENLLARYGDSDLRLALAGRNERKLEGVRDELARRFPAARELPLLVADSRDRAALDRITAETSVLCTTVGPYAKYGAEVVASCVENATDYCDLTGETQFVRRMIDAHHERARQTGARIVHCCGYDSIPSDLGTLMIQRAAEARYGTPCREVKFFAGESSGGFSGGTLASMFHLFEELEEDPKLRRVLGNPYGLDPDPSFRGPDGSDQRGVRYDDDLGVWTAPFIMAAVNTRVVRRSHALMDRPWGRGFRYSEVMSTGGGPVGFARATAITAGLGAFAGGVALKPTRGLLRKRLPQPGEGPSEEAREKGSFVVRLLGLGTDQEGTPFRVRGKIRGEKDPGYGGTAIMLSEAAMTLAVDREQVSGPGGVLTPAVALGEPLIERLRDAGMTFEVT
jgi:short subunit dehydrogenase-like uncharacterized protein